MSATGTPRWAWHGLIAMCVLWVWGAGIAHAQLFGGDDQARRAILDLRAKVDALSQESQGHLNEVTQTRRQLLELTTQLEQLRRELATVRGDNERLSHELSQVRQEAGQIRQQADQIRQQTLDRLKPFESTIISMDGLEFNALPAETAGFDAAMAALRASQFVQAAELFAQLRMRYPNSGYLGHALYWEGNAHYAARQYQPAVQSFDRLIKTFPQHPKAAETLLSMASCHVELKDVRAARAALERLVKEYPSSEAAQAARERLARLR